MALCDCDRAVLDREVAAAKKRNANVEGYTDIRQLLENRTVVAITTATPDHWHALATIWACRAGKDVYVEKPLSYRLGKPASGEAIREAIKDRGSEAAETFERFREHLTVNGVDWTKTEAVLGPWLEINAEKEEFVGSGDLVAKANRLVTRQYRAPFVVPETV